MNKNEMVSEGWPLQDLLLERWILQTALRIKSPSNKQNWNEQDRDTGGSCSCSSDYRALSRHRSDPNSLSRRVTGRTNSSQPLNSCNKQPEHMNTNITICFLFKPMLAIQRDPGHSPKHLYKTSVRVSTDTNKRNDIIKKKKTTTTKTYSLE